MYSTSKITANLLKAKKILKILSTFVIFFLAAANLKC